MSLRIRAVRQCSVFVVRDEETLHHWLSQNASSEDSDQTVLVP